MTEQDIFIKILEQNWYQTPNKKAVRYIEQFWDRTRRGHKISARVEGNHGTYIVSIEVKENEIIDSACSCYIGKYGGCHHCTALAHTYLKNPVSFTVITPIALEEISSLDDLQRYLNSVTLESLIQQLKKKGISQKAFAESIGISTQKLGTVKRSEDRNRYSHELGAIKLACVWVLQNLTENN